VGTVGGLSGGKVAQHILESNRADVIFVGRQFQKNPGQVWAMADEIGIQLHHANQIRWGFAGRGIKGLGSTLEASDPNVRICRLENIKFSLSQSINSKYWWDITVGTFLGVLMFNV